MIQWGNTPTVELRTMRRPNIRIFAKLEGCNPGGSIKDRIGMWLVWGALKIGTPKNVSIIEATSGNTGVGIAQACKEFGYHCILYVPRKTSLFKINKMKSYDAEIRLVDGTIDDCISFVDNMSRYTDKYYWTNQFDNIQSITCHHETTAPEIHKYMSNNAPNYFAFETMNFLISAMGTTGTIMGCSKYLLSRQTNWYIYGVMPHKNCKIEGLKNLDIQRKPKIYNKNYIDKIYRVTDKQAIRAMKMLAKNEAICAGISSGAAVHIANKIADNYQRTCPYKTINICVILPDTGLNYMGAFK